MGFTIVSPTCFLIIFLGMSSSLIHAALTPVSQISACKMKCNQAFLLCRSKVATTPKDRVQCAKLYVTTFPSCFFAAVPFKNNCEKNILRPFSNCVMESLSYGETFACTTRMQQELKKCQSASSKREKATDSSVQACNECFGFYDVCIGKAKSQDLHDICVANRDYCTEIC